MRAATVGGPKDPEAGGSHAFHSPLMEPDAWKIPRVAAGLRFAEPVVRWCRT